MHGRDAHGHGEDERGAAAEAPRLLADHPPIASSGAPRITRIRAPPQIRFSVQAFSPGAPAPGAV